MNSKLEKHEVESIEKAIKYMIRFTRLELKDEKLLKRFEHKEESAIEHNDLKKEEKFFERSEGEISDFLEHLIKGLKALITIELDEEKISKDAGLKEDFKAKINREIKFLIKELRKLNLLNEKTL